MFHGKQLLAHRLLEEEGTCFLPEDPTRRIGFDVIKAPARMEKEIFFESPIIDMAQVIDIMQGFSARGAVATRPLTKVDYVYNMFKTELEREHFGEFVAIDTESERIVGIGDTVLSAYDQAKKATGKEQYDFKRAGYRHLKRI
jgi:hypothetical protein